MGRQSKHLYINLPVKHVNESKAFFEQLGFDFQQELTNEHAACFVMNETITVMLLSLKHFQSISEKELVDARNGAEATPIHAPQTFPAEPHIHVFLYLKLIHQNQI